MTATRRLPRYCVTISVVCASVAAQSQRFVDFADLIRTPSGIQRTLEHCDGHPDFEVDLANWLEMYEPSSPVERRAVRETSLRLLEDTTDSQIVLGLTDGLLRHALQDIKRDPGIAAEDLARTLYTDICKVTKRHKSKAAAVLEPAYGLRDDGTVTDGRQAGFLDAFLSLADPHMARRVRPAQRQAADSAGVTRVQGDRGVRAKR